MILQSLEPFQNSRIDLLAEAFIRVADVTPNDYLFVSPYSIGDVYHTLTLIDAFRARYCTKGQRIHLICNTRCVPLATLFNNVERCVGIECGPHELALEAFAQRYPLGPGVPFIPEPDMHSRGWLSRVVAAGKITQLEAKKMLLELDMDTPISHPKLNETQRQEAYARAKAQGLAPGSVIIFNHAKGLAPADPNVFSVLSSHFGENVFYDATVNGAGSVPWAKPLDIPLGDVPFYAELAGNVVAIRSGIVDLLSAAECNLVTIYPNAGMLRVNSPDLEFMAELCKMARLEHLGLRTQRPEYTVLPERGDGNDALASKLAALLKVIPGMPRGANAS